MRRFDQEPLPEYYQCGTLPAPPQGANFILSVLSLSLKPARRLIGPNATA